MDPFAPEVLAIAATVAIAAGVIRGITGFGGAMVMTPPLALLAGPLAAVPVALLLECLAAAPMLVRTRAQVRWRVIGPIVAAGILTIPLGAWFLVSMDPVSMRRAIAATVVVFSLVLLAGWRYHGEPRLAASLGVGALCGALLGATGMGGPPAIVYLLAGPDRVEVARANLTWFVGAIAAAGLVVLAVAGALAQGPLVLAALLAPGYYAGMVAGTRLFPRFDDRGFRRFTLAFLAAVSLVILLA
ncbi:MAG: sulfite exporter TauE/SafE family protein [Betaproteobacteria bacterium]|nr:sulfite exporter TauE/SafE family protein [Betaproteobacteria bacterium]